MRLLIIALLFPFVAVGQGRNFGVNPGLEATLGYKKVSEIGLGLNLYASKIESSRPFLVHAFSCVGLYNSSFHEGRFALRFPYTLYLYQVSYTCMPSISVFTEFNQNRDPDYGFRLGIVLGTTLHLYYTYTKYQNNSDNYFGTHGISLTYQVNFLHFAQFGNKHEPRFRKK